jgi:hypothetical protein
LSLGSRPPWARTGRQLSSSFIGPVLARLANIRLRERTV